MVSNTRGIFVHIQYLNLGKIVKSEDWLACADAQPTVSLNNLCTLRRLLFTRCFFNHVIFFQPSYHFYFDKILFLKNVRKKETNHFALI